MADRLRTSGVRHLSARSLSDCVAIADNLNDAVSDAKCKVDCITLTGDVDADAAAFDSFGNECEDALACISALRLDASRRLTALSDKIDSTHRLDMAKVNAQVDRIVAGLRYNLKRTLSGERTAFDKTVVQKNLQNLSNKAKGGQTLQVLVESYYVSMCRVYAWDPAKREWNEIKTNESIRDPGRYLDKSGRLYIQFRSDTQDVYADIQTPTINLEGRLEHAED